MRGLDKLRGAEMEKKLLEGLLGPAREAVLRCERTHGDWFSSAYHRPEGIVELYENLNALVTKRQDECSHSEQVAREINFRIQSLAENLRKPHIHLQLAQQTLNQLNTTEVNPHLSFLRCIETRENVSALVSKSTEGNGVQYPNLAVLHALLRALGHFPHLDEFEIVACPVDGTKLRVPRNRKRLRVSCASCGYKFIVNSAPIEEGLFRHSDNRRFETLRKWFRSIFVVPRAGGLSGLIR